MNIGFVNTITINGTSVQYDELKVKHLKIIYKTLIGDTPEPKTVFNNFTNLLTSITNLSKQNLLDLSIIDYFIVLLYIRCTSIGNIIFAELSDSKNTKIEININKIIDTLEGITISKLLIEDTQDLFTIHYQLPTINDCIEFNIEKNLDNLYYYFIKTIEWNGKVIDLNDKDLSTKQLILSKLPAKITATIIKKVHNIIKTFNEINLLGNITQLKEKVLAFNFNIENLILLLKLLFGDQLMSLYDNIFVLSKYGNLPPQYIENCTPGEYFLYVKKLKALNAKQEPKNIPQNDNIADPFSDLPPVTSRSEFTP